ncbi:MAG: HlyD family type I secretion periplasmic adaptor subunit [Caulobacteraceae bacterium]|nr:HlyD family type I secretion periplasmic adaptor subunit [Caulobacteraceae bacterium]
MVAPASSPGKPHRPAAAGEDDPRLEIWFGGAVIAVFFAGFLGWAALTPLDAAAYASGQVAVASHRQEVQHREGGVVRRIDVREGQYVRAGDVLVELVGADVAAAEQSLVSQVVGLQAQRARLHAEAAGARAIQWPGELAGLTGEDRRQADDAMAVQQAEFHSRAADLASHAAVLRQRMGELDEQADGYRRQLAASQEQQRLIAEELKDVKSLADQGYAPMSSVRALERSKADLEGRRGELSAEIAQAHQQSGELRLQILQLVADQKQEISKDLRDVDFQLSDLTPRLAAAQDQMARSLVRAPVSGTVVGLTVFTVGGVVAPGQRLLDVVPDRSQLVIEAQIAPGNIDGLHVGQTTEVRLGERDRALPILKGTLTMLSADSLVNEKTGARYFTAEVTIPPSQLAILKAAHRRPFHRRLLPLPRSCRRGCRGRRLSDWRRGMPPPAPPLKLTRVWRP